MIDDDPRSDQVRRLLTEQGTRLDRLAETRCPHDGRLLGGAYSLPDGLWIWSAGSRPPARVARAEAAALVMDAMTDEARRATQRDTFFTEASDILSFDIRPTRQARIMQVEIDPSNPDAFRVIRFMPFVSGKTSGSGKTFMISEVTCGCRRSFHLNLRALIRRGVARLGSNASAGRHVRPLPLQLHETRLWYHGDLQARA